MNTAQATLHALAGRPGSPVARALIVGDSHFYRGHSPLIGAFPRFVWRVSGSAELVAGAEVGLPEGPARAEAIAVRLRRHGVSLSWGEPEPVTDAAELVRRCAALGRSSIELVRADSSLVSEMHVGTWFAALASARLTRRIAYRWPVTKPLSRVVAGDTRILRMLIDAAFWTGAREMATDAEWLRLTASAYVALLYHRMGGEDRPGEEKLDIGTARLASQLRLLRRLRFTMLTAQRQLSFHADANEVLPARSVAITVDDGFLDCVEPLLRHVEYHPQLFIPTGEVAGRAHWMAGEPVMGWDELESLGEAGVTIGPHARTHRPLVGLEPETLAAELAGSLADIRERLPQALPVLSYPNGRHDERVCAAAAEAGFVAAYTTEKGLNGAGTDSYCLKRVSVYSYDGPLAFAWKALTGQGVPSVWERRRVLRLHRGTARPPGTLRRGGASPDALVSLVMAAFQPRREWLLEAVHSALGQRGCRVELIVVDDGSPEPVAEALAQIDDPRLRVLRVEHGGPSRARNAGVASASGEYVRFVDSDDVLEPDGTAHLLALNAGQDDVIAYGATLDCDEDMNPLGCKTCRLDGSLATACLLDEVEVRVFSMLFPRAVLEATGNWEPGLPGCRDWDYALRAFEHARVRGDETVVTRYRRHQWGVTADMEACLLGERGVIARYFERHPEHRGTAIERRSRARLRRTEAWTYQGRTGHRRQFARAMGQALRLAPVDTTRELARDARARAPGLIVSLLRTARARVPR